MNMTAKTTKVFIFIIIPALILDTVLFALMIRNEVGRSVTAGVFAGLFGTLQWLVGVTRERERSIWEAIQTYYTESDSSEFRKYRHSIRDGTASEEDKAAFVNFYEKWGRLVRSGYLPLYIFDGASGISIVGLFDQLGDFVRKQKERNPCYADSYDWLVRKIRDAFDVPHKK